MSNYNQSQGAYPPPATGYTAKPQGGIMDAPPIGYPMTDGTLDQGRAPAPATTRSRGDGFWKGCCAAICCCCVLDACF